jgi:hypothetical protein
MEEILERTTFEIQKGAMIKHCQLKALYPSIALDRSMSRFR